MGFDRGEVANILAAWPHTDNPDVQEDAVNNVLNNLLGYPHNQWRQWYRYSLATPEEIAQILARWRGDDLHDPRPHGTFDRLR